MSSPAGITGAGPTSLPDSEHLHRLVNESRRYDDVVVIDTSPHVVGEQCRRECDPDQRSHRRLRRQDRRPGPGLGAEVPPYGGRARGRGCSQPIRRGKGRPGRCVWVRFLGAGGVRRVSEPGSRSLRRRPMPLMSRVVSRNGTVIRNRKDSEDRYTRHLEYGRWGILEAVRFDWTMRPR